MNWTLDQLEAFVCAVQQGSFSAAARKLGKAQSRVSTAIANLEVDLGFDLFDRTARLPVLTQQGKDMYLEAQAVLSQCQRLQSRALTLSCGEESSLTIAMDEAVPLVEFERFFGKISQRYPLLKLTIINGSQDDIAQWIDEKKADIGILFYLKELPDSLEFIPIGEFRQSLIISIHHPLAKIAVPTFTDLNQYRQLVIRNRMGEAQTKTISSQYWHIDSYYTITALVLRGVGWALVPEHVASAEWYNNKIIQLSTQHITDPLLVVMGVVKRRDKGNGPVMNWMHSQMEIMFSKNDRQ